MEHSPSIIGFHSVDFDVGTLLRGADHHVYQVVESDSIGQKWARYCEVKIRDDDVLTLFNVSLVERIYLKTVTAYESSSVDQVIEQKRASCNVKERKALPKIEKRRGRPPKVIGSNELKKKRKSRPPTAYNLFLKSQMPKIMIDNPGLKSKEYMSICAALWEAHKSSSGSKAVV